LSKEPTFCFADALSLPSERSMIFFTHGPEPKPTVWFDAGEAPAQFNAVMLDRRTRMLYDARHLYINGESFRAGGRDATLMRKLADQRALGPRELAGASEDALALLGDWCEAGWLHAG